MISTMSPKLRAVVSALFWLAVWQITARLVNSPLFLPTPPAVFLRLAELVQTAPFWQAALLTLCRVMLGMLWGTVLGMVLACLTCLNRWLDAILSPAVQVIRATPVASFILLVFLWTDRDQVPVIISALMVLPVVWGNAVRGIRECDPKLLELAKAYRFSRVKTARLVLLPAVRPYLLSAVTTSLGLAWKSGVAAEALVWPKLAIGTQIYNTKFYLETADLFAWTVVVVVLSLTLEKLIATLIARREGRAAL